MNALKTDEWASFIGEFAFGINPHARLSAEEFLEVEKIGNTCHVAFGNNTDFPGGKNSSGNHMDFLMSSPNVTLTYKDGTTKEIVKKGEFNFNEE